MDPILLYTAVGLVVAFAFVNGFHDGCNVIATIISSRTMRPRRALVLAALAELVGPLVLGTAVAATIASKVLDPALLAAIPPNALGELVLAAVGGAIAWNLATWWWGLPSSSSHALIGGLIGAGLVLLGPHAVAVRPVLLGVVLPLFVSPILGFLAGALILRIVLAGFGRSHPTARHFFARLQTPGLVVLAMSHGSNDAQKSMGLIALLLAAGRLGEGAAVTVPLWAKLACALAIAAGLSTGGWRIIRTVGYGIFRMRTVHSFSSQYAATGVVLAASLLGGPVSTTQVVASSVIGVGASRRLSGVRWTAARNIAYAWIFTIPAAAGFSAGVAAVLRWLI